MEKYTGFKHVLKATEYSMKGLKSALTETAFRHELLLVVIMIPLAFYLGDTKVEIALMVGSVLIVLALELLNSAIEAVVDRVGKDYHELSGRAKDQGSAAVFIGMVTCAAVWAIVLFG